MPQVINSNVGSLNAQRSLNASQTVVETSLRRLSTGLRISSAKDDAAGMAITERFSTQIRGNDQAVRNANDGISYLQTAEGAMAEAISNLQRIRELGVQAANGTNSTADRQAIQHEIDQLIAEIDRVGRTTQFNGQAVFARPSGSVVGDANQLAVLDGLISGWLEQSEQMISTHFGLTADGATLRIEFSTFSDGQGNVAARVGFAFPGNPAGTGTNLVLQVDMADFVPPNLPNGGSAPVYNDRVIAHEMVHAVMARTTNIASLTANDKWFAEGMAEFIHGADERLNADYAGGAGLAAMLAAYNADSVATSAGYSAGYAAVRYLHDSIKAAGGSGIKDIMEYLSADLGRTLDQAIANASSGAFADRAAFDAAINGASFANYLAAKHAAGEFTNADTGAIGGLDADGGAIKTAESVVSGFATRSYPDLLSGFNEDFEAITPSGSTGTTMAFQVGADVGQTITTTGTAMSAESLGLVGLEVVTNTLPVMTRVDRALDYLNGERSKLGAQMSRFESAIASLRTTTENLSSSRSRILDADFAAETAGLTRALILQQAGAAMLAQANSQPQQVLALLR